MAINIDIVIILFWFAPRVIIINGPSATFGSELSIVRYGSNIFAIIGKEYSSVAIKSEIIVVNVNDINTSLIVVIM